MVENGTSFERAIVDFSLFRGIVIPEDAVLRRGIPTDQYNLYVEKKQCYKGYPEKKLHISATRGLMGVAFRASGQAVALATFGDWGTDESGGRVRLCLLVPTDMEVQRRPDLSGLKGMANGHNIGEIGPGVGRPKAGWTIIATDPNVEAIRI